MVERYYPQIEDVHLPSGKYVLVLPGWYPSWQDPFTGDFNQRHVRAAGIHTPQVVLYIAKDLTQKLTKTETRYNQLTENIIEIIVIYPQKNNKWFDIVYSNLVYLRLLYYYAHIIENKWGKPLLIHSYIVIRGGLSGMLLGTKWKIPFILSEHWTIYYPQDPGYLLKRNQIFRWTVKKVFEKAKLFLPVTKSLQQQVYTLLKPVPSTIIPNVVETKFFYYKEDCAKENVFRFVHVSNMVDQKNPKGLLRGFKRFREIHAASCLWMVGPYPKEIWEYAASINLSDDAVHFTGAVSYQAVAEILRLSQALAMFSNYENLPCVILEALCCGLPVLSTNVGGISEVIDVHNGILIDSGDEEQLTAAFIKMFTLYKNYDRKRISDSATSLFSYHAVSSLFYSAYSTVKTLH